MLFRLSDVTKSYAGNEVLRGVSFQINPGEKVGLVGRNGAGKSTIFRVITGQEVPDTGEMITARGLKIGVLDQHVHFEGDTTVHDVALSAFEHIQRMEVRMRELEVKMASDHSQEILDEYAELQIAFEQADGFTYAVKAESILLGLGFNKDQWNKPAATLSGGQKNRLGLAKLLISSVDILLLDEPTNHLDVSAVEWLEDFLTEYGGSYVVISHDRYFLDRTTNRIIEVVAGRAVNYIGNYSKFLLERELRREQQLREYENQQSKIAKTEEFIRRNLEGQKTKQAKSRRNMLERMERVDAVASERHGGSFGLKKVERSGNNVLTVDEMSIGYSPESPLAKDLHFSLLRGEVLGIIGGNGTGKTTLLKTLLGNINELSGKIMWGAKTNIGYYAQNLDELEPRNEVIQELRRVAPMADNGELRSFLARFLFVGEDVFKNVSDLSGGEKGRLALAKLIYSQKNVLILDEPTNHLDIPAREALEAALQEYDGTIITVSHDRFFLDKVATQILSFEDNGEVTTNFGNYTDFHNWKININKSASKETSLVDLALNEDVEISLATTTAPNVGGLSKNQLQKIEKRVTEIESEIPKMEEIIASMGEDLNRQEYVNDFERLNALTEKINSAEDKVKALYAEWEHLAGQIQ